MRGLLRKYDEFWFAQVSPYPSAAFRILYGTYLLIYFGRFVFDVELMFSRTGVYVPFAIPDIAPPAAIAWVVYGATIATIILFILGWRTRVITPLLLMLFAYHWLLRLAVHNASFDRLNLIFLSIACFAQLDRAWSIRNTGCGEDVCVLGWAPRLLGVQLALLYFGSGLWKLSNPNWHSGEALSTYIVGPYGGPVGFWIARLSMPSIVFDGAAWSVIAFELVAGFALYNKWTRSFILVAGFVFHSANCIVLYIPEFMHCVTLYVFFMEASTVRNVGQRLATFFHAARTMRWGAT